MDVNLDLFRGNLSMRVYFSLSEEAWGRGGEGASQEEE